MNKQMKNFLYLMIAVASMSCSKDDKAGTPVEVQPEGYKTENVVIVVIDGPRYSETWAEANRIYIPNRNQMLKDGGVMISDFSNNGQTKTNPGHAAVLTGKYHDIDNSGIASPNTPSILQQWLKFTSKPASKAWIIASKDKLDVLSNTSNAEWKDKFRPSFDCGKVDSKGKSGYRTDEETMAVIKTVVKRDQPNLLFVNLLGPDSRGHANDWTGYLAAIKSTDAQLKEIWDLFQTDERYKGKTTLIVTNDHGRHLDGVADGFVNHGDQCAGCKHIEFFAIGPDFKQNLTLNKPYEQKDIASTAAKLLNLPLVLNEGKVITDIFK